MRRYGDFSGRYAQQAASHEGVAGPRSFLFDSQSTTDSIESSLSQASTAGPESQTCASRDQPHWVESETNFSQVSQSRASHYSHSRIPNSATANSLLVHPGMTSLNSYIQTVSKRMPSPVYTRLLAMNDELDRTEVKRSEGTIDTITNSFREQTIHIYDDLFKETLEALIRIKSCFQLKDDRSTSEKDDAFKKLSSIEQELAQVFDFVKRRSEEIQNQNEEMLMKLDKLEKSSHQHLENLRSEMKEAVDSITKRFTSISMQVQECKQTKPVEENDSANDFDIFSDPFEERAKHKADQRIAKIQNRIKSRRVKKNAL